MMRTVVLCTIFVTAMSFASFAQDFAIYTGDPAASAPFVFIQREPNDSGLKTNTMERISIVIAASIKARYEGDAVALEFKKCSMLSVTVGDKGIKTEKGFPALTSMDKYYCNLPSWASVLFRGRVMSAKTIVAAMDPKAEQAPSGTGTDRKRRLKPEVERGQAVSP